MTAQKKELTEECDKRTAKYILKNIDSIEYRLIEDPGYNPKAKMVEYLNKMINSYGGKMSMKYKNKNNERFFVENFGAQNMIREFRHTLFRDMYYDIDIVNCHPVILEQYCRANSIQCPHLTLFIKNRDTIFESLLEQHKAEDMTKDHIKLELLKIMNGGRLDNIRFNAFEELDIEMKQIMQVVTMKNPEILQAVKKSDRKYNIEGSVLNHMLCREENKILMAAVDFFQKNNFIVGVLCFDGLMVKKNKLIDDHILNVLNDYIKESVKYNVKFLIKDMKMGVNIGPEQLEGIDDDVVIKTDTEGAELIKRSLNNKIIKCDNRVFIRKFEDTNIYEEDTSRDARNSLRYLMSYALKLPYKKEIAGELKPYSENITGAKALAEATFALIEDQEGFIKNMWESNVKKLCFLNGYYDYEDLKFKPYSMESLKGEAVYTSVYVPSIYDPDEDLTHYTEELNKHIINPIFHNKVKRDLFFNWCSRGLAGEFADKTWGVGLGCRDTGKSVMTSLFMETFGSYVGTFNAEELLCNRVGNGDIAKKLSWAIPFQFRRLNFSNEMKMTDENGRNLKLDGNQIKSVSSGGDPKRARLNYKDEVAFQIQGRMCLFMNDLIKVDVSDVMDTLQIFEFNSIFKNELTEDDQIVNLDEECPTKFFLKDNNIKDLCRNEGIKKAFIKFLIESYTPKPICTQKAQLDLFKDEEDDTDKIIKNHYIITHKKTDIIRLVDFIKYNKIHMPDISKAKMKMITNKLGASEVIIKEDGKTIRAIGGIKIKEQEHTHETDPFIDDLDK